MDKDDIKRAVEAHTGAARRAKMAGYDGAEIFAAFGLLQAPFLSKAINRRTGEYGGSLENRMRFLLETIDAVRNSQHYETSFLSTIFYYPPSLMTTDTKEGPFSVSQDRLMLHVIYS